MKSLAFLFVCLGTLGSAAVASAAVPSPVNSSVDFCLFVCPRGDVPFHVIVRDAINQPIANSFVQVFLCSDTLRVCPMEDCTVTGLTNAAGQATFFIHAGGPRYTPVTVVADGVQIGLARISTPDQNGDLVVDGADLAIGISKLGMADYTMDLDCDVNTVDAQDIAVLQSHLGHVCPGPTPTRSSTWGHVKTIYR